MSVNNIYNCDAHPWPKNTVLIAGDSMINGINEKLISTNIKSVKFRYFSRTTIGDMYFSLIPLLRKKPAPLVLHVGTGNTTNKTSFQIYDKLLNLVHFIKEKKSELSCFIVFFNQWVWWHKSISHYYEVKQFVIRFLTRLY